MSSSTRDSYGPNNELGNLGFRVASIIPEPATLLMLGMGGLMLRGKK